MRRYAVLGPGEAGPAELVTAEEVGRLRAAAGAVLVCGGLGGVMKATARVGYEAGGLTVGILPGWDRQAGNRYLSIVLPTGLGELRNGLVVGAAEVVTRSAAAGGR
jgi:uncharacterized protein (TIGR00725 family)